MSVNAMLRQLRRLSSSWRLGLLPVCRLTVQWVLCGPRGPNFSVGGTLSQRGSRGMVGFPGLCRRVVRHWRGIVTLLIAGRVAFYLIYPDEFGRFFDLIFFALFLIFIAGQIFWIKRIIDLVGRFLPIRIGRTRLAVIAALVYVFVYACSYPGIQSTNEHVFRTNYDRPLTV